MKKTQKQKILDYMKREGSISQMEAFSHLHIVNLPGRIYDLKRDGVPIDKYHVCVRKDGERIDFDRYFVSDNTEPAAEDEEELAGHSQA